MNEDFWPNWLIRQGRRTEATGSYRLPDLKATAAFARLITAQLKAGDVVALSGKLGVGKTAFAAALAEALGLPDEVASPTFILVMEHEAPAASLNLYHFDVYRLADSDEFLASGLDEYFDRGGVCVIEWPERISDVLPQNTILLRFYRDHLDSEERRVEVFM